MKIKALLLPAILIATPAVGLNAQTNTFPSSGNVGIGSTTAADLLTITPGAARKGITILSEGDANVYSDIQFKIANPGSNPTGKATFWVISHRKDGYFSGSSSGESSLEFYTVKQGGGYWAPLCLSSSGDVILASPKNASSGNVGINTTTIPTGYKLAVNGSAIFTKAVVKANASWPDYVFEKNYSLMPLDSVEAFVQANGHLPEIASADEVSKTGIDLGDNQTKLLQKMEELTLYLIDQNKRLAEQNKQIQELKQLLLQQQKTIKQLQQDKEACNCMD